MESLYNINANELDHYKNFTDYEKEEVAYWQRYVILELLVAYLRKHGRLKVLRYNGSLKRIRYAFIYGLVPREWRRLMLKYGLMVFRYGVRRTLQILFDKRYREKTQKFSHISTSVRKVNRTIPLLVRADDVSTATLREGRW